MNLNGNTIFIAGGTSGIGLGLGLRLHQAGNTVILGGRRADLLAEIAEEHPGVETVVVDTADPTSIRTTAAQLIDEFPALNVVVLMAGIMHAEDLRTADFLEIAEATVTTNLLGPIRLIAAFTEFLASQSQAAIVTVSSGLAFVPMPATATYSATKAAIHSLSVSLRQQLVDTTVQVIELAPPAVQTELFGQTDNPHSMPLAAYLTETMDLLAAAPEATEILVERVKFLRNAEIDGTYAEVLGMLSQP